MAANKELLERLRIERPAVRRRGGGRWLGAVVVAALLAAAWWVWQRPRPVTVQTALAREVTSGDARTLLNASGYVTARRLATISSKVTGRVLDVLVEEGVAVEPGQVLAHLDATNVTASRELAQAQAEAARRALGETEALLAQAQRTLQRTTALAEAHVVSAADLDQARADAAALAARLERQRADVAVAEREVVLWQQQCDDTVIRAPFAGVVVSKNAQAGEMISPISAGGGFTRTGICTIVDMTSLEVEVDVNESYINRVTAGQPVTVTLDSYPDWHPGAKVVAIVPTADRQKATVRVRIAFDRLDPRILPDMGLKVAFQTADETAAPARHIVVPRAALRRSDGRDVVWVVRDGRAERRAVGVLAAGADEVAVDAGLAPGEKVVLAGAENLNDGSRVREDGP